MADILVTGPLAGKPRAAATGEGLGEGMGPGGLDAAPAGPAKAGAVRLSSGHAPTVHRLAARLADRIEMAAGQLASVVDTTLDITRALQACGAAKGSFCLMPASAGPAMLQGVAAAGLLPYFLEADGGSRALETAAARATLARLPAGRVGAVLPAERPGRSLDLAAWHALEAETGVPVVIAGPGGSLRLEREPDVASRHAGEGGSATSRSRLLAGGAMGRMEAGFLREPISPVPAMSDDPDVVHATPGLVLRGAWPDARAELDAAAAALTGVLSGLRGLRPVEDWITEDWGTEWLGAAQASEVEPTLAELLGADPAGTIAAGPYRRHGVAYRALRPAAGSAEKAARYSARMAPRRTTSAQSVSCRSSSAAKTPGRSAMTS